MGPFTVACDPALASGGVKGDLSLLSPGGRVGRLHGWSVLRVDLRVSGMFAVSGVSAVIRTTNCP